MINNHSKSCKHYIDTVTHFHKVLSPIRHSCHAMKIKAIQNTPTTEGELILTNYRYLNKTANVTVIPKNITQDTLVSH